MSDSFLGTWQADRKPVESSVAPNHLALLSLSQAIWDICLQTQQRPLVLMSTAGSISALRIALEKNRPKPLPPNLVFLPEVCSLKDWLDAAPNSWGMPRAHSSLDRWLEAYVTIAEHPQLKTWFAAEGEGGAWGLAQAIIDACDLLSNQIAPQLQTELMRSEDALLNLSRDGAVQIEALLQKAIDHAYPALAQQLVHREAQIVLLFWRYLNHSHAPVFRKQLALIAHLNALSASSNHSRPLIWISTAESNHAEHAIQEQFLQAYAQLAPVMRISMDWDAIALWPEALEDSSSDPLSATKIIQSNIDSVSAKQVHLISSSHFEELAWEAARRIQEHAAQGRSRIALVAQDRLLARRTRALLARVGKAFNVRDETGWKLSTTRAAAAFNAWLELLQEPADGPSAVLLLEFLKNPFIDFASAFAQGAKPADQNHDLSFYVDLVLQLENALVHAEAKAGWASFHYALVTPYQRERSENNSDQLAQLVQLVRGRLYAWQASRVRCCDAFELLKKDLDAFGMTRGFENDAAGIQLLTVLDEFALEGSAYRDVAMPLREWLALVKAVIEEQAYQEEGEMGLATVSILPLSAIRLRQFDALVMVGCDEKQLPAYAEPPLFFSELVCEAIGANTIEMQFKQQARDLSQLLMAFPRVDFLYLNQGASGERLRASPWIERLQQVLPSLQVVSVSSQAKETLAQPLTMAIAQRNSNLPLPTQMSPSAYRILRSCPYRYYVRSLLGLREVKGLEDEFDASLAGIHLHAILRSAFQALKSQELHDTALKNDQKRRGDLLSELLMRESEKEFASLITGNSQTLGILRDWQKQIPSLVRWQLQRESEGWRFHDGEVALGFDFEFTDHNAIQHVIRIQGYADRVDIGDDSKAEVLDYKNQNLGKIKKRASALADDPQLIFYAHAFNAEQKIAGHTVQEASWVALKADLKKGNSSDRSISIENLAEQENVIWQQVSEDLSRVWSGHALKAFAPDSVCQYCEARGICRKGMW